MKNARRSRKGCYYSVVSYEYHEHNSTDIPIGETLWETRQNVNRTHLIFHGMIGATGPHEALKTVALDEGLEVSFLTPYRMVTGDRLYMASKA